MKREGKVKDRIRAHFFGNYFNLMQYMAIALLLLGLTLMKLSPLELNLPFSLPFTAAVHTSPAPTEPLASASRLDTVRSHWLVLLLSALAKNAAQAISWTAARLFEWMSPGRIGSAAAQELCFVISCVSSATIANATSSNATLAVSEPSDSNATASTISAATAVDGAAIAAQAQQMEMAAPSVEPELLVAEAAEAEQWLGDRVQTAGRVLVAAATVLFYCRVLHFFMINKELGPKVLMVGRMVCSSHSACALHIQLQLQVKLLCSLEIYCNIYMGNTVMIADMY